MTAIAATATALALAELVRARDTAENELHKMRRINSAFKEGRREFLRRGFSPADFQKFANTIERHPEYGPVPFPPRIVRAKVAQVERIRRELHIANQLLTTPKAS